MERENLLFAAAAVILVAVLSVSAYYTNAYAVTSENAEACSHLQRGNGREKSIDIFRLRLGRGAHRRDIKRAESGQR